MAYQRTSIPDFSLANDAYPRARVTFYQPEDDGTASTSLATLYASLSGSTTLANPQTLDSDGKFQAPVYIEEPVVAVVSLSSGNVTTGVIRPPLSSTDADTVASRLGTIQGLFKKILGLYAIMQSLAVDATEAVKGRVELATNAEAQAGSDSTNKAIVPSSLAATAMYQGKHSISIPASALIPRTTNGAAAGSAELATNRQNLRTLDFDAGTIEYAQCFLYMPKSWDEGTIEVEFDWTVASGSGDVIWTAEAIMYRDDDPLDTAWGTAVDITDTVLAANDRHRCITAAVTPAGTGADHSMLAVQVSRKASAGGDTVAVDAKLLGIKIHYTTSAKNDA